MEIEYTVFPGKKTKCIEIRGDEQTYGAALKLIGARRVSQQKMWTLASKFEGTLRDLLQQLGKNPDDVCKIDPVTRAPRLRPRTSTSDASDAEKEEKEASQSSQSSEVLKASDVSKPNQKKKEDEDVASDLELFGFDSDPSQNDTSDSDSGSDSEKEELPRRRFSPEKSKPSRPMNSPQSRRHRILSSSNSRPTESIVEPKSLSSKTSRAAKVDDSRHAKPNESRGVSHASKTSKTSKTSRLAEMEPTRQESKISKYSNDVSSRAASSKPTPSSREYDSKASKVSTASSQRPHDEYSFRYNEEKFNYYRSLGRRHLETIEDESTSYTDSSDGFPSPSGPSPVKKGKYSESEVLAMEKRIRELERRAK